MARRLRRFLGGERGTVSVEFVVWIPVFLVIMGITADACKLYLTQADMWDVARDTTRRMSTGQFCDGASATSYARTQLLYSGLTYTFTPATGAQDTFEISTPVAGASVFGVLADFGGFSTGTLQAKVTMPAEPGVCS